MKITPRHQGPRIGNDERCSLGREKQGLKQRGDLPPGPAGEALNLDGGELFGLAHEAHARGRIVDEDSALVLPEQYPAQKLRERVISILIEHLVEDIEVQDKQRSLTGEVLAADALGPGRERGLRAH